MDAEPVVAVAYDAVVIKVEPSNPIHNVVLMTCGVTNVAHHATLIEIEGLDLIAAFMYMMSGDGDITEMAKCMALQPSVAAWRVILGTMQIKKLQALVYWVKDNDGRGMQASPELWTMDKMNKAMERNESEYNYGKIDVLDIINPAWQVPDGLWMG
ncbi:hypothetical protein MHU86_6897 [Fragilaria crotonensis]|nr:hypothetical protein MHU86_6897 [Fragilaria crotonensis]